MNLRQRIFTWLRLGRPPLRLLLVAIFRSIVSNVAAVSLFIAATALLVISSKNATLQSIAIFLIVIELIAFMRSPLRFLDRLGAHQLGFAAVQQWRRVVTSWITSWDSSQAAKLGHGEILDRALRDTEELQNLWLRTILPGFNSLLVLALSSVILYFIPGGSGTGVLLYLAIVGTGAGVVTLATRSLGVAEANVREARGNLRAVATEASRVAASLRLLKSKKVVEDRLAVAVAWLQVVERRRESEAQIQRWALLLASFGALFSTARNFTPYSLWQTVSLLIGFSAFDLLGQWESALTSAVSLDAAMSRLEALEPKTVEASGPFPANAGIHVHDYLVQGTPTSFSVPLGSRVAVTGPSGIGKSTVLRAIAGMEDSQSGYCTIGGVPIGSINQAALREFVTYVPTESSYVTGYVEDVIELGRDITRDYVKDLRSVGLKWKADFKLVNPSRGERARVAVVRAMATTPAIIVLDEPSSGLGETETTALLSLLENCDATIIIATHDPLVMSWCDTVIRL
jgi:ABC-type transport system involved in cytochrome bd biosynthesis fused ATPase/permease subunit